MFKKFVVLGVLSVMTVACGGSDSQSVKVKSLQKKDKNLSCREILLEMNEAQFYDRMAHKNRGVKLKNVLMPLGYISTYMDSEDAIGAAQARVEYLDKIYEIMRCEDRERELEKLPVYQGPRSSNRTQGYPQYSGVGEVKYYLKNGNANY